MTLRLADGFFNSPAVPEMAGLTFQTGTMLNAAIQEVRAAKAAAFRAGPLFGGRSMIRCNARVLLAAFLVMLSLLSRASASDTFEVMSADWGISLIFLLPIIAVETFLLRRRLGLPRGAALKAVGIANVISALAALPAMFLLFWGVSVMFWGSQIYSTSPWDADVFDFLYGLSLKLGLPYYMWPSGGDAVQQITVVVLLFPFLSIIEFPVLKLLLKQQKAARLAAVVLEANALTTLLFVALPVFSLGRILAK